MPDPVPTVAAGDKNDPPAPAIGRRTDIFEIGWTFVKIGTGKCQFRVVRQINQHGELLDENIGVRLKPEARFVLAIFDTKVGTGKVRTAGPLNC